MNELDQIEAEAKSFNRAVTVVVPYRLRNTLLTQLAGKYEILVSARPDTGLSVSHVKSELWFEFPPTGQAPSTVEYRISGNIR